MPSSGMIGADDGSDSTKTGFLLLPGNWQCHATKEKGEMITCSCCGEK